jgi:hypothetical protein
MNFLLGLIYQARTLGGDYGINLGRHKEAAEILKGIQRFFGL